MKNIFIKYPAILFSICFIASLYLLMFSNIYVKVTVWAICLILILIFSVLNIKLQNVKLKLIAKYGILIISALLLSIIVQLLRYDLPMSGANKYAEKTKAVTAYIREPIYNLDHISAAQCVITQIEGKDCNIPVYATFESKLDIDKFEYFTTTFEFSNINNSQNDYNTVYSFAASDIRLIATSENPPIPTGEKVQGLMPFFSGVNSFICNRISSVTDSKSAGLINAVLFGNKDGLSSDIKRDFNTLGITHLLVVSGMNIAIIAGMVEFILLNIFKMKRWQRSIICSLVSIIYMALCGFSLTVMRAAFMQVLCRISINAKAQYHTPTSLFISIAVICMAFPGAIYDIGLILSFLATLGIVTFGQYADSNVRKMPKLIRPTVSSLVTSIAAGLFVLPVSYYVFGSFSIMSPIATLVFGVFLDIILYITPVLFITSFIPVLGAAVGFITDIICTAVLNLTSFAYVFKDLYISFNYFGAKILIIMLILSIILGYLIKPRTKILKTAPAFVVFMAICLTGYINSDTNGVYYFCKNSNDAIILNYNKENAVIDISTGSKSFLNGAIHALRQGHNTTSPDIYVLTHYHNRHISTVEYLANSTHVEKLLLPYPTTDEEKEIYDKINNVSSQFGIKTETYRNTFSCGGGDFKIYEMRYIDRSTHPIVTFEFVYDNKKFSYFGGASFENADNHIANNTNAHHLIFGEHGPLTKEKISNQAFNDGSYAHFCNSAMFKYCSFQFSKTTFGSNLIYSP